MANTLKIKRGTAATIPQGQLAEPLFTTDTYDLYIGKGSGGNQRIQNYIASGTSSQFLKGDGSLDSTTYQATSEKGQNNGYASLDSGGKVPAAQLPNSIMDYKGTWDASTNTPTLADGTGNAGDVYICSVGGTQNLGSGSITFAAGDWVVYSGSVWQKSINSNAVASVNGQTGAVVLYTDDISEDGSPTNLWFTNARARTALSATSPVQYNNSTGVISILDASASQSGVVTTSTQTFAGEKTFQVSGTYVDLARFYNDTNNKSLFVYADNSGTGLSNLTSFGGESIYFYRSGTEIQFAINGSLRARLITGGRFLLGSQFYTDDGVSLLQVNGQIRAGFTAATSAATRIVTVNSSDVMETRTPAQILSDIGALPLAGGTLTGALSGTSATFSTLTNTYILKAGASGLISNSMITDDGTTVNITRTTGDIELGLWAGSTTVAGNSLIALYSGTGAGGLVPYGTIKVSPDAAGNTRASKMVFATRQSGGTLIDALSISSTGAATFSSSVTASSFVKSGGTAAQILAADGTVITAGTNITISGGSISAADIGFANPMTTLGDIIYGAASGTATRLAGNTTASKRFLIQTGDGTNSAAPSWGSIAAGDVPTLNQNTTGSAATLTTARTLTIGATGRTFDGSTDRTWTLADIGAAAALSGTINTIAYWNSATTIASLATATYPSLTELSYVKGVTSAIQTQLDAKEPTVTKGNLTETTSSVLTITGGTGAVIGSGTTIAVASAGAAQAGVVTTGTQTIAGLKTFTSNVHVGGGSAAEYAFNVGEGRTGNGNAYIDLIGDVTYSDYGLRMIRGNTGANADSSILHRGTGSLILETSDGSTIRFRNTAGTDAATISSGNLTLSNGGDLIITAATSGSNTTLYNDTGTLVITTPISGTSATFSSTLATGGDISVSNAVRYKVSGTEYGVSFANAGAFGIEAYQGTYFFIGTGAGASATERFRISSTGAATFSGDLTVDTNTLYVDSTNNRVGIGTTAPATLLHLSSATAGSSIIRIENTSGTFETTSGFLQIQFKALRGVTTSDRASIVVGRQAIGGSDSDAFMAFYTNTGGSNTEKVRITANGNVGIGTTSPSVGLAIQGSTADSVTIQLKQNAVGGRDYRITSRDDGSLRINDDTAGSERMRITSGGNVLINATTDSTASGLFVNSGRVRLGDGGGFELNFNTSTYAAFQLASSEKMRITSGGELLINTTTDSGNYKLQVNGNIYAGGGGDLVLSPASSGGNATLYNDNGYFQMDTRLLLNGSIKTSNPNGGTAAEWKLGSRLSGTVSTSTTNYLEVDINGTLYYLAFAVPL